MIEKRRFGSTDDGRRVDAYTLRTEAGFEARVLTYGGIIQALRVPDRAGRLEDVVLGFDSMEGYQQNEPYFGAIIGRYSNRIAQGRFTLDGRVYQLPINEGPNHMHGGIEGFDAKLWSARPFEEEGRTGLALQHTSPDGDEGYPGTLSAQVTYTLTEQGALVIDYRATADRPTPVSLTQHTYFNLAGTGRAEEALAHEVTLQADAYVPIDETQIPTGETRPVAGTPFDFRAGARIGERLEEDHAQLKHADGYDHSFVVRREGAGLVPAARAVDPASGRVLEVRTTAPVVHFYSGNQLDGSLAGKAGRAYGSQAGFCFETQRFPDAPNHPSFPSAILRPGAVYQSRTVLAFSAQ